MCRAPIMPEELDAVAGLLNETINQLRIDRRTVRGLHRHQFIG